MGAERQPGPTEAQKARQAQGERKMDKESEKVTPKNIMDLYTTYSWDAIRGFFSGRDSLTYEEIAKLDLPEKRIANNAWLLSHLIGYRHPYRAQAVARRIALDVVHLWPAPDAVLRYLKAGDVSVSHDAWLAAKLAVRRSTKTNILLSAKATGIVAAVEDAGPATLAPGTVARRAGGAALLGAAEAASAANRQPIERYIGWALETVTS